MEHESLADWLSFHHNEKREWMRYGAAMYREDVRGGEIRGNTVRQGMNGLLVTRTDSLLVVNNDFSFNSGLGIGLYRSDRNRIMHNRVDYNVRGYSDGFYRRGQDSAGILIYQQRLEHRRLQLGDAWRRRAVPLGGPAYDGHRTGGLERQHRCRQRLQLDGALVHEDWSIHESRVHEAPLSGGAHDIRVEYFQRDGWTELRSEIIGR